MKKLLFLYLLVPFHILAQGPEIYIPYNASISVDGNFQTLEWQTSLNLTIPQAGGTDYHLAWDSTGLYVLAAGNLESGMRFPEILINPKHSLRSNWQAGTDWWFHVSATDCESDQSYGDYSNCQTVQNGWLGVPNMSPGPPATDTVEIFISFNKIGFNPASGDTLGFAAVLSGLSNPVTWPASAGLNDPSTWGKLVIQAPNFSKADLEPPVLSVYPNPAREKIYLESEQPIRHVELQDIRGKAHLEAKNILNSSLEISDLKPGLYLLKTEFEQGITSTKIKVE